MMAAHPANAPTCADNRTNVLSRFQEAHKGVWVVRGWHQICNDCSDGSLAAYR